VLESGKFLTFVPHLRQSGKLRFAIIPAALVSFQGSRLVEEPLMRRIVVSLHLTICAIFFISLASASAATITAYTSFGGGDGWLAPGEGGYTFLGTANNERGLAHGNGHVYLVSRSGGNSIRVLGGVDPANK